MSVSDCIAGLVAEKTITEDQAERARAIYRAVRDDPAAAVLDESARMSHAAVETGRIMREAAEARKLDLARRAQIYSANLDRLTAHPDGPVAGFMALLDRDIRNRPGDRVNVSSMQEDYASRIASAMHEVDAYKPTLGGLKQDTFGIRQMVREVFGAASGNPAAQGAAKGWKAATDFAVKQAKDLGRTFDTDADWRLPQFWDSGRVAKFGDAAFRADLQREVDGGALLVFDPEERINTRVVDGKTVSDPNPSFNKPVGGARRDQVVRDASRHIREDRSRSAGGMSSVFKQEQRVFRFKDGQDGADAYLRLMDKYGAGPGGFYGMLQNHAQSMARELGLMHVLGPKPAAMGDSLLTAALDRHATVRAARDEFTTHGTPLPADIAPRSKGEGWADRAYRALGENETLAARLNDYMLGRLSGAGSRTLSGFFSGLRSWLTSANLGSAVVSAVPGDTVNIAMAARYNGLDAGRIVNEVVREFGHHNPEREAFAAKLGILSSATSRIAIGTKQYGDELLGRGLPARAADFVIRAQRLHHWDAAAKNAWTMEVMASIGDRAGKAWEDLDAPFKGFLTNYGLTPGEWSTLANIETLEFHGAKFAMPDRLDGPLRAKLMSAVNDEKQGAYLAGGSNRIRATTATTEGGTWRGELSRSIFMYKTFAMSMVTTHGLRAAQEIVRGDGLGRFSYAAQLGILMTLAGAISYQAKQVLQGKDPLDMTKPSFWAEAAFQGGAAGIFGDFLRSTTSRTSGDLKDALFGPISAPFQAIGEATSAARRSTEDGKSLNAGALLANDVQRFTPGSSLWYSRLLFSRAIVDTLHKLLDPDHAKTFQRARDRAAKTYGQGFWWAPGDVLPDRGPNLRASAGTPVR